MKRIIALIMAVLMTATLFVGCSDKVEPAKDLENVKSEGKLRIGYTVYQPMNYTNDKGEFVGFDTEYAKLVCKELGVEAEFIKINWDTKEVDLNSGNIDCIWNGFTITKEREEQLDFSTPYLRNKQVVVIRTEDAEKFTDAKSLEKAKITAEKDSAGETAVLTDFKNATYVKSDLQSKALMAVKSKNYDACVVDLTVAQANAGKGDYKDLMILENIDLTDEEYGIGFRTGSNLTAEVNKITEKLQKDGTLEKLAKKYDVADLLIK